MSSRRPRAVMYYRISKRAKNDVRMQRKTCRDFCSKQKLRWVKEYVDSGFSGRTKNRPALKQLLRDIEEKKIEYVLIYKLDRLGRNFSYLNSLLENFEEKKIKLVSATQNFDNSTPEGKFMLRMLTILAEFESGMTSKRIVDGLKAVGGKNGK